MRYVMRGTRVRPRFYLSASVSAGSAFSASTFCSTRSARSFSSCVAEFLQLVLDLVEGFGGDLGLRFLELPLRLMELTTDLVAHIAGDLVGQAAEFNPHVRGDFERLLKGFGSDPRQHEWFGEVGRRPIELVTTQCHAHLPPSICWTWGRISSGQFVEGLGIDFPLVFAAFDRDLGGLFALLR